MRYWIMIPLLLVAAEPPEGEAVHLFTTKVHPVLQNSCASCHSAAGSKYPLQRQRGPASRDLTAANQAASLQQFDRANPANSPLLVKAIAVHGGQRSPAIRDANAPAYKFLEQWVKLNAPANAAPGDKPAEAAPSETETVGPKDPFDPAIFNAMKK